MFVISTPTPEEQDDYFEFRWQQLRRQWGYPKGSEKDEYESVSEHRVIKNHLGEIVACGRIHLNTAEEAQIRHIAVDEKCRRHGLGQMMLNTLEQVAKELGAERAVTNSREASLNFFKSCGFEVETDAPTELGALKRKLMVKNLADNSALILHTGWCKELQDTWYEKIPISEHMGIKLSVYTERTIETKASLNKNINLHGTMFAGSIYSQATLTAWGMIYLQLKQQGLSGEIVLGDAKIHYHKPVTMRPRARCNIESFQGDLSPLKKGKKAPIQLKVDILNGSVPVAEFSGKFYVLPSKAKPTEQ